MLSSLADLEFFINNNLLGNPYPSSIDRNADEGWSGFVLKVEPVSK